MNLEVKNQFHGFTVRRIRPIPGQAAELVEMIYDKTKTELVWVKNHAENKLFAIGFKTHFRAFRALRFREIPRQGALCRAAEELHEHVPERDDVPG